ncbi:GNAT family N-acetyltransferase [uncultured Eudoraea sp.]|uniref:GNAT family N-acetyltransferase n=1 Tax=uncultured Eudoraea sp. TaxID=1035614 RepID=UPI0026263C1F|nr:GNAT family N-acetyltransferase [uncultured Eudoraea sp.]
MKDNPFTSDIFTTTWLKHFNNSGAGVSFDPLRKLLFVRHKVPKLYVNCGKTHTKGINYSLDNSNTQDLKGKALLIYDVPTYFEINPKINSTSLRLHKIKQYPGFLIKLDGFKNISEYINATFKGKSRNKLKRDKKRLENSFDIKYEMYYGKTSKEEYDTIFESFKILLEKRFEKKGIYNNNLNPQEWNFYYEVAYPMILAKKACLFVVRERNRPISIMLNFLSEDSLYQFIMAFDVDYAKFNVGTTSLMKLIEWCLEKELKVFDFSKGYFDFKKRWSSLEYQFEYHVLYDKNSLQSFLIAFYLKQYFMLKQFLREKKINELIHSLRFSSKNKTKTNQQKYTLLEVANSYENHPKKLIDVFNKEQHYLKPAVIDFLYYNSETLNDIKVYKILDDTSRYLVSSEKKSTLIQIE